MKQGVVAKTGEHRDGSCRKAATSIRDYQSNRAEHGCEMKTHSSGIGEKSVDLGIL